MERLFIGAVGAVDQAVAFVRTVDALTIVAGILIEAAARQTHKAFAVLAGWAIGVILTVRATAVTVGF